MREHISYQAARELVIGAVTPVDTERLPLESCAGRVLAEALTAAADVPPFDRSPYDGYAFRASDSQAAAPDSPVTLRILEEIPAGGVSHTPVTGGTAVKILTGAPIPTGADAVVKWEATEFTAETVTLFRPARSGANIVPAGEDVKAGAVLAPAGSVIDPGLMGTLAAQNVAAPLVYKIPKVGIISTGSELTEVGQPLAPGKIYDSSRYTLTVAVKELGCQPVWLGTSGDDADAICALIEKGLKDCDALVVTGGVSVGDYDLTPAAMELARAEILFRGTDFKPGMACAYAARDGKLLCGLSGNPAAALTNFYAIAAPALRKLCGRRDFLPEELTFALKAPFPKKSPMTRLLRGRLCLSGGRVEIELSANQANGSLSSAVGWNAIAVIPAGTGPLEAGTELKGFLL